MAQAKAEAAAISKQVFPAIRFPNARSPASNLLREAG
jgi:hypothetical protein